MFFWNREVGVELLWNSGPQDLRQGCAGETSRGQGLIPSPLDVVCNDGLCAGSYLESFSWLRGTVRNKRKANRSGVVFSLWDLLLFVLDWKVFQWVKWSRANGGSADGAGCLSSTDCCWPRQSQIPGKNPHTRILQLIIMCKSLQFCPQVFLPNFCPCLSKFS